MEDVIKYTLLPYCDQYTLFKLRLLNTSISDYIDIQNNTKYKIDIITNIRYEMKKHKIKEYFRSIATFILCIGILLLFGCLIFGFLCILLFEICKSFYFKFSICGDYINMVNKYNGIYDVCLNGGTFSLYSEECKKSGKTNKCYRIRDIYICYQLYNNTQVNVNTKYYGSTLYGVYVKTITEYPYTRKITPYFKYDLFECRNCTDNIMISYVVNDLYPYYIKKCHK